MQKLGITYVAPDLLSPNKWNPNKVDPINQEKLEASLNELGFFDAVKVRTLPDGSLEILGGEHRWRGARSLGHETIPIMNLGLVDDDTAKKIVLIDNANYGEEEHQLLEALLSGMDGSIDDLMSIMPFDAIDLEGMFEHGDLDDVDLPDTEEPIELAKPADTERSHQILRFKVSIEDAEKLAVIINNAKAENGFVESDDLTNAGDALMHIFKEII
jgi:ParB-like chromosome segregation protein Spo0J